LVKLAQLLSHGWLAGDALIDQIGGEILRRLQLHGQQRLQVGGRPEAALDDDLLEAVPRGSLLAQQRQQLLGRQPVQPPRP
jgi:hypothetical protein